MTPAIVRTTGEGPMLFVPEAWGVPTEEALATGAVRLSRVEILSRFGQSEPVGDTRLAGEIKGFAPIRILGRIGGIEVALIVEFPTSIERYRLHAQRGWVYNAFAFDRIDRIEVCDEGTWIYVDTGVVP